ncbi:MAG TPA: hypothetical protein VM204_01745, partial [Gaiellaceae bacterium]|nr:hypothetical protein [Gaiellaceae bacterium]
MRRALIALPPTVFALMLAVACEGGGGDAPAPALVQCGVGASLCEGACVQTAADPGNCGACGRRCDATRGEVCSDGACSAACPAGVTRCAGACVDLATSAAHCGGCGNACGTGAACVNGACACPKGFVLDGGCADIDECATTAGCSSGATCANTPGSFACTCGAAFTGAGLGDRDER